jgi:hypothetical protein
MVDVVRALVQGGYVVPTGRTFPALALRDVPNELRWPYRLPSDRIKIVDECHEFLQEHPVLSDNRAMLLCQFSLQRA